MREKPEQWDGTDRIQWGCALMQMLGEDSLERLHLVLAGYRSIERSRQVAPFAAAVRTARVLLGDLLTLQAVRNEVLDFLDGSRNGDHSCSYDIDHKTLHFSARFAYGLDPSVEAAERILCAGLPRRATARRLADTTRDLVAHLEGGVAVPIRLHGLRFEVPRRHDLAPRQRAALDVRFPELVALADELDARDVELGRPSLSWGARVRQIRPLVNADGLRPVEALDLSGVRHLIGLPGAGKTTLITLLCVLLAREGKRVAVFFTSIAVARDYLETLRRYDVGVALLMGRSGRAHRRHADDLAELIAGQGMGGFARTCAGAELLGTSCALTSFAEPWPEEWRLGEAPCEAIGHVGEATGRRLCPAWELCGRVRNQRELVTAGVWLGHVLSADTTVPDHTAAERLRYFELIAETFDLVIFDECDETQRVLDARGALVQHLTGSEDSLHYGLVKVTEPLASNRGRYSDDIVAHAQHAFVFQRHTLELIQEIRRLMAHPHTRRFAEAHADKLLTAHYLLNEALAACGKRKEFGTAGLSAVADFWEEALYSAFRHRSTNETSWLRAERHAPALSLPPEAVSAAWVRVNGALKRYLTLSHTIEADEVVDDLVGELARLMRARSPDVIRPHVRLLVVVGFTVASYQRLAKIARPLIQRGELPADEQSAVFGRASRELRDLVPRSLLGTFSGVRYRPATSGSGGLEIDYLMLDVTPRVLLHRLHELGSANVLLASATSWLEDSTEYHVDHAPDYVLAPPVAEPGRVRLYLLPQRHPVTGEPLRFSGAGERQEENLRHMVASLAATGADGLSELERAVRALATPLGRPRKAALIVNSYDQVHAVIERLHEVNPRLGERARGVLTALPAGAMRGRYVLKGQVEELGGDDTVNVVVFPMAALGRGINGSCSLWVEPEGGWEVIEPGLPAHDHLERACRLEVRRGHRPVSVCAAASSQRPAD